MIDAVHRVRAIAFEPKQILKWSAVAALVYCVGMTTLASADDFTIVFGFAKDGAQRFCTILNGADEESLHRLARVCGGALPNIGLCCEKEGFYIVDAMTCPALAEHVRHWVALGMKKIVLGF